MLTFVNEGSEQFYLSPKNTFIHNWNKPYTGTCVCLQAVLVLRYWHAKYLSGCIDLWTLA